MDTSVISILDGGEATVIKTEHQPGLPRTSTGPGPPVPPTPTPAIICAPQLSPRATVTWVPIPGVEVGSYAMVSQHPLMAIFIIAAISLVGCDEALSDLDATATTAVSAVSARTPEVNDVYASLPPIE